MVPTDRALATFYKLSAVTICSGLAAIVSGKFQAISGRISKTLRFKDKVNTDH